MKRSALLIIFLPVFLPVFVYSQIAYSGRLIDSLSKEPVEFANIGLPGKGIGTVSNEKGEFKLEVPDSLNDATLRISMIGYATRAINLSSLGRSNPVLLVPESKMLNEITIAAGKYKTKILGHETRTNFVSAGFRNNSLGAEIAVPLHIKNPHTQLRKFMLNISRNSLNTAPIFRLNVYEADKNGYPGRNILTKNIVITPIEKEGFIEVDLIPYGIFVNEDVLLSIEWIKDLGDATGLYFSTKLVGNTSYFRQTSQDKWEKTNVVGVGIHAEVGY